MMGNEVKTISKDMKMFDYESDYDFRQKWFVSKP